MVVFEHGRPEEGRLPHLRDRRTAGGRTTSRRCPRPCARRFTRLAKATRPTTATTRGFAAVPNLVVIDGGKGQLSAALGALDGSTCRAWPRSAWRSASRRSSCRVARTRSCSRPTRRPCCCCSASATRRTGSRSSTTGAAGEGDRHDSLFERLPGVGPARKKALLAHFGSPAGVLAATADELEVGARAAAEDGARDPRLPEQDRRRGGHVSELHSVVYEAPGWGLGEVVYRGDVAIHHESPRRRRPARFRAAHAGAARADRPARRLLRGRARDVRRLRPRTHAGVGRRDAVRGALPARAAAGALRRDRLLRRAGAARRPRAGASRGRLGLRARYPLDRACPITA